MNRRRTIPITLATMAALLTMLAACGGATAESAASEPEPPATTQSTVPDPDPEMSDAPSESSAPAGSAPAPQPGPGEAGSFTVDGTTFAVTLLNRCIPFTDEPGNLDVQALAQGAQLNLYLSNDRPDVSIQGSAVQELAGSIAFGLADEVDDSTVSGDRWTGSATLEDSMGSDASVDVTWDVQIPSEVRDCSL